MGKFGAACPWEIIPGISEPCAVPQERKSSAESKTNKINTQRIKIKFKLSIPDVVECCPNERKFVFFFLIKRPTRHSVR